MVHDNTSHDDTSPDDRKIDLDTYVRMKRIELLISQGRLDLARRELDEVAIPTMRALIAGGYGASYTVPGVNDATGEVEEVTESYLDARALPLGAIVAVVDLVDVVPMWSHNWFTWPDGRRSFQHGGEAHPLLPPVGSDERAFGYYQPGRWMWILKNPRRLMPIPCKGAQGLWTPPAEVIAEVARQMEAPIAVA